MGKGLEYSDEEEGMLNKGIGRIRCLGGWMGSIEKEAWWRKTNTKFLLKKIIWKPTMVTTL